jgi:hypothetical protein
MSDCSSTPKYFDEASDVSLCPLSPGKVHYPLIRNPTKDCHQQQYNQQTYTKHETIKNEK